MKTPEQKAREKLIRDAKKVMARDAFLAALTRNGIVLPVWEHYFAKPRQWRFDYAWEAQRVALEVDGGLYTGGRHTRGAGAEGDHEKLNAAAVLGWRILRTVPRKLCTADVLETIRKALDARAAA
jgi:hypothetical protein